MAKNTSKKIKELKGIKPEKISEEELTSLQETIRNIDKLTAEIGRYEIQKQNLLTHMQTLQETISDKRTEFMSEYGSDNINIQTGEIAYPEETTNPEENGQVNS